MSSISAISSMGFEEAEKRVSEDQSLQGVLALEIGSSLVDSAMQAMDSVSGTDTTTTDSDDSSSTDGATNVTYNITNTDSSSSSDQMTTNQQLMLETGEDLVQMLTGVSSSACDNQSAQDGNQQ